jgi:hypothetical protein
MDLLYQDELKTLAAEQPGGVCLSLYMPTHQAGPERYEENRIRFKNLLKKAETKLLEADLPGMKARDVSRLLEPAEGLLENGRFWAHQSEGLAIFLNFDNAYTYNLPLDFEEMVLVGQRFHIKPLLPLFTGNGRFFLLALSQNQVRLLQGTRHSVSEIELGDAVPANLQEAIAFDDPEDELQLHTSTASPGGMGKQEGMFFGHSASEEEKDFIFRYFRQIDDGLRQVLEVSRLPYEESAVPLLLAGVDYLHPIYRRANSYPYLLEEGIHGNPEHWRNEELHERAWPLVEPHFAQAQQQALARFHQALNSKQASYQITEVIAAAYYGRVDTLFTPLTKQLWGRFNQQTGEVTLEPDSMPDNDDLLDMAAIQTLLNGGAVYAVPAAEMPEGQSLAAIFRY